MLMGEVREALELIQMAQEVIEKAYGDNDRGTVEDMHALIDIVRAHLRKPIKTETESQG